MKTLVRISAILLYAACLQASDNPPGIDIDLPQPLDLGFADTLVTQSPFSRSVDLEESLQLTGLAYIDGRPVATILNKATKQRIVVSEEPNAQGWKLVEAAAGVDLNNTEVHLMVGPEVITMHYNTSQLEPKSGNGAKGNSANQLANGGSGNRSDNKFRASSYLGENGRQLFSSLSPDARNKFKDLVKSYVDKRPEATAEQNSAYAQKVFSRIKAADGNSTGSVKTPKTAKTGKRKPGA